MDNRSASFGNPDTRYKFTGKERDIETGYNYFGAHYYDSRIGRWLTMDPLAEKGPAWSPYNYSFNNPILFYDPNGNWPFKVNWGGVVTSTFNLAGYSIQAVTGGAALLATGGALSATGLGVYTAHGVSGYVGSISDLSLSLQGKEPTSMNAGALIGTSVAGEIGKNVGAIVDNTVGILSPGRTLEETMRLTGKSFMEIFDVTKNFTKQATSTLKNLQVTGDLDEAGKALEQTASMLKGSAPAVVSGVTQMNSGVQSARAAANTVDAVIMQQKKKKEEETKKN